MGMVDSQSCSSSNRASMDGTSNEKEEEAKAPELVLTCWGFSRAYSYPEANIYTSKKSSSRSLVSCLQWLRWPLFSPNWKCPAIRMRSKLCRTESLMQSTPATVPGRRRRVFFLAQLEGRKIFDPCFLCLSCNVQDLGGILGSWRFENLEFLQNSEVCRCERMILPGCLI